IRDFHVTGVQTCALPISKYVSIINAQPNQAVNFTKINLTKGKSLVRKTFQVVDDAVNWLLENPDTLVELTMETDTFLTTDERKAIFQAHSGIVHLIPKVKNSDLDKISAKEINLNQDIKDLFKDYFKSKNANQEPNNELMDLFNEVL